jgi:hypothetical protein
MDVNVLIETYVVLKQFVPAKDHQEAADNLISTLVDYLADHDLNELCQADANLKQSFKEYVGTDIDNSEEEEW